MFKLAASFILLWPSFNRQWPCKSQARSDQVVQMMETLADFHRPLRRGITHSQLHITANAFSLTYTQMS